MTIHTMKEYKEKYLPNQFLAEKILELPLPVAVRTLNDLPKTKRANVRKELLHQAKVKSIEINKIMLIVG